MGSLDAFRTSQGDLHQDVEPDSCLMLPIPVISVLFLEDRNGKTRYCMVLGTVFVGSEDKVFSKCSKPLISLDVINSHFSRAIQTIKIPINIWDRIRRSQNFEHGPFYKQQAASAL